MSAAGVARSIAGASSASMGLLRLPETQTATKPDSASGIVVMFVTKHSSSSCAWAAQPADHARAVSCRHRQAPRMRFLAEWQAKREKVPMMGDPPVRVGSRAAKHDDLPGGRR